MLKQAIVFGVFFLILGLFLIRMSLSLQEQGEEALAEVYHFGFLYSQTGQAMLDIAKPVGYLMSAIGIIGIVVGIKFPDRWK